MSQAIAQRYATALFELADESYQIDKVVKDMDLIHQAYLDSADLQSFVHNPVIPVDKRIDILAILFEKRIEQITFEFLKLLAAKERLEFLDTVALEFKVRVQKNKGALTAHVRAATKLSGDQSKEIAKHLKKRLDKDIDVHVSVDETMLGGFKIQIEDQVFDYTLDHQLKSFKEKVLKG